MTAPGSSEESEIKIPVPDLPAVRRRLSGAERLSGIHLESNVLFDDAAGRLLASGTALRLRRARGRALVTFKGRAAFEGAVKRREELETEVADAATFERVLERLGFVPKFRYDKRREEFRFAGCVVALDETPIGTFVEIEGEPSAIEAAATDLGLDPRHAVRDSYAGLYRRARESDPSLPPDMVFQA
ncbi:MAG TPA: class IV adenylate cyclase [Thermoanaerobaculia bacterium]|nr:class IV adenylate cyclase [Thermoanaerobaculia bacterium]